MWFQEDQHIQLHITQTIPHPSMPVESNVHLILLLRCNQHLKHCSSQGKGVIRHSGILNLMKYFPPTKTHHLFKRAYFSAPHSGIKPAIAMENHLNSAICEMKYRSKNMLRCLLADRKIQLISQAPRWFLGQQRGPSIRGCVISRRPLSECK